MRVVLTIIAGVAFTIALGVCVALMTLVGYPVDTDAFVGTTRDANLRGLILDTVETAVVDRLRASPDPVLTKFVTSTARSMIEEVITEDRFYGVLTAAHRGLAQYLEGGSDAATVDLGPTKTELRTGLHGLGEQAMDRCVELGGPAACRRAPVRAAALRRYRREIDRALDVLPDTTHLTEQITIVGQRAGLMDGPDDLDRFRRWFSLARGARAIALVVAAVLLGLIVAINVGSAARLLTALGLTVALAGGICLAGLHAAGFWAHGQIADAVAEQQAKDATIASAQDGAGRLADAAVDRVTGRYDVALGILAGTGVVLALLGLTLGATKRPPTPAAATR